MKKGILLFVLGTTLTSCSCNYHLKRIEEKCPDMVRRDTIYNVVPERHTDTLFLPSPTTPDTITLEKDGVVVQVVHVPDTIQDTIYIDLTIPPDTTAVIPTAVVAAPENPRRRAGDFLIGLLAGTIATLITILTKRKNK